MISEKKGRTETGRIDSQNKGGKRLPAKIRKLHQVVWNKGMKQASKNAERPKTDLENKPFTEIYCKFWGKI